MSCQELAASSELKWCSGEFTSPSGGAKPPLHTGNLWVAMDVYKVTKFGSVN
jgi:hypothetical protein